MPQPKSAKPTSSSAKQAARTPAAKRSAGTATAPRAIPKTAAAPAKKHPNAGEKPGSAGMPSATKASRAPRASATAADPGSPAAQAARDEAMRASLMQLRELLAGGVMLTAQRVQEAMDDAVRRGKMTRRDAEEIARGLVDIGRKQSLDMIAEIEQLFGRGRSDLELASTLVREKTERVLREVERVRRGAGVGPSLPIDGYDDLTAAQIAARLDALSPSDLRQVREHERRTANRKSVLAAVDKALG
ncbi:MAG: plectin [Solirubrobacterales bacterium]|nr:plectin [Solirubrobacterales bacterium]